MTRLADMTVSDLMKLRGKIRGLFAADEVQTFEDAAQRVVDLFRKELLDDQGEPACALIRIYKTHRFALLPDDLKQFALSREPAAESLRELRCLVMMATAGDEPRWNSRRQSRDHQAIPLSSEAAVAEAPMVSQLIQQLGIRVAAVLRPDPALLLDMEGTAQNVFYIPVAQGSQYIPAQEEFVKRYGIQSVVGFGGLLSSGDLVAGILFSKVPVSAAVADHFKVIGLNFKLVMLPFARKQAFREDASRAER